MTPKQAAEALGLEYTTALYHLKKTGRLTGHKDGQGHWQVDADSVAAFREIERPAHHAGRKRSAHTVKDPTRRAIFLGTEIGPEEISRIRRLIPARLRAAVLLRLADMAENEPENFKRALKNLGVEW